jgi:hypothetical protein
MHAATVRGGWLGGSNWSRCRCLGWKMRVPGLPRRILPPNAAAAAAASAPFPDMNSGELDRLRCVCSISHCFPAMSSGELDRPNAIFKFLCCEMWALFRSPKNTKSFQDFPSHRICWYMYGALNVDKK